MTEEDKVSIRAVLIDISALTFSQAARVQLHATSRRRLLALESLTLPKDSMAMQSIRFPVSGNISSVGSF